MQERGATAGPVVAGLVVAAGRGTRFGGDIPKQYRAAAGKAVLRWSIEALLAHPLIKTVQVVIAEGDEAFYEAATRGLALPAPVHGGATRQQSVRNGLAAPALDGAALVLIHDAARPLLDSATISRLLNALEAGPAAIAAVPVADTLKKHQDGRSAGTVDRTGLWRAQTPQAFQLNVIRDAHAAAAGRDDLTDDAAVAEAAGVSVDLVLGSEDNFKVTTPSDLARAEALLRLRQTSPDHPSGAASAPLPFRIGKGFDVHAFEPGEAVILCGIKVPHGAKLAGHSDADVGLHALTDALLGAIAAGDIGRHFPPSDMRWKGGDSTLFLRHAAALVEAAGYRIANVDVTLICERPKIGPHRRAMEARVAALLGLAEDCVSVKATTTERLGFTGREEGIAAEAVALLMR